MVSKTETEILGFLKKHRGKKYPVSVLAVELEGEARYTWINEKVKGLALKNKIKLEVAECIGKDGKTHLCRQVWVE